ncbi:hypothetical protein [Candidatus Nanopusillus massiliensis]|uniref:hypothetical protein n=1 Tax=Candidatus Nanopusillus massiliensis TaxID=2897163 RepID=UPI001E61A8D0|nr:hypothetical protein [Candidatus Nanopusillus massiliensis]
MFTENKASRIFEVVKNMKYDEYVIWNKAIITQDLKSRPLKKSEHKHIYNSSSIVLNIKDKDKVKRLYKKNILCCRSSSFYAFLKKKL